MRKSKPKAVAEFQQPRRVQLLLHAANLTSGVRDREYGPPSINLGCAGNLKKALREGMIEAGTSVSPAFLEALDMVLVKVARAATGKNVSSDTFADMAAYAGIAGELYE